MKRYKYSFSVSQVQGEYGHTYPLLTANEYPWMNIQIVPTPDHQREIIMEALHRRGGGVATAQWRTDFAAIQAGGGTTDHPTIEINAQNYQQVALTLRDCLQAAADFWAAQTSFS